MRVSYDFLNGLRGYGAFTVFIHHARYELRQKEGDQYPFWF